MCKVVITKLVSRAQCDGGRSHQLQEDSNGLHCALCAATPLAIGSGDIPVVTLSHEAMSATWVRVEPQVESQALLARLEMEHVHRVVWDALRKNVVHLTVEIPA